MTRVFAKAGPHAGQYVDVPEDDVDDATAEDGWAVKLEEGAVLQADPAIPHNPKWKIPGVVAQQDQEQGGPAADTTKTQ